MIASSAREHESLGPGYYREQSPAADLRHLVACTWIRVGGQRRFGTRTPIIPDG